MGLPSPAFVPGAGARLSQFGGGSLAARGDATQALSLRRPVVAAAAAHRRLQPTMARGGYDYERAEVNAAAAAETYTASKASEASTAWTPADADSARAASVRKQMEFWFSPSNLKRDWFLRRQMDEEGWLDPSIFLKFNRLKQLNVSLPEVIEACKGSSLLEVSAPPTDGSSFGDNLGQTRVRRSSDLPAVADELEAEAERSLVVEGLPDDVDMSEIRDIFSKYGVITYTWISRPTAKEPDSYAIVSYSGTAIAIDALSSFEAQRPAGIPDSMTVKSKVLYDSLASRGRNKTAVLEFMGLAPDMQWREVWEDITVLFSEAQLQVVYFLYKNGDPKCYVTVPDQETADAVLEDMCEDQSASLTVCDSKVAVRHLVDDEELIQYWTLAAAQILERKKRKERFHRTQGPGDYSQSATARNPESPHPEGVILRVQGLPPKLQWQLLMSELKSYGDVVFLNYQKDSSECYVRFADPQTAAEVAGVLAGSDANLVGTAVDVVVLEGDEEAEYWSRATEDRKRKRERSQRHATSRRE
jgi:La domain/RNA binding motif/RNA recognition motif. (a.k.a. RRM, RBD, or RNP domain)